MLEEIRCAGWQRWTKKTIEFDPRITVIVGPSETGKSAIIRALKWLCLNQWNGDVDVNHDSTVAKVTLRVDGHQLVRKHGVGNLYRLDNSKFKAFGKSVPEAISKLLNMTELNFQDQHDPHFWLSASAGQVSKELNSIIDLEIIDRSIAAATSSLRQSKATVEVSRTRLKAAKQQVEDLNWIDECASSFKKIQKLDDNLFLKSEKISSLQIVCQGIYEAKEARKSLEQAVEAGMELVSLARRWYTLMSKTERLDILLTNIKKQKRINQQPIPKIDEGQHARIEALRVLIDKIKEQTWLSQQKCPACGRTL